MLGYFKLNVDGTIQSRSKQPNESWISLDKLVTKEDGTFYKYYLTTPDADGMYQPDLAKEQEEESLAYQKLRAAEYAKLNQFEMQFDDSQNGTNTWQEAILAIKAMYPKPL